MDTPLLCVDVCLDPCLKETSEELLLGNILDMSDTFAGLLLQVDDWLLVEESSYSGSVRSKQAFGLFGLVWRSGEISHDGFLEFIAASFRLLFFDAFVFFEFDGSIWLVSVCILFDILNTAPIFHV